jgi:hypothetical protein
MAPNCRQHAASLDAELYRSTHDGDLAGLSNKTGLSVDLRSRPRADVVPNVVAY